MTKQEGIQLFNSINPNFFEREHIKSLPRNYFFDEMILELDSFDPLKYSRQPDNSVTFGLFEGELSEIKAAVGKVDINWTHYFNGSQRIYCGYWEGEIASFCMITDFGVHTVNGRELKIGGPGCVGTVPRFRDRGIGLTMVKQVTRILKDEGYDLSYIHYTSEAAWYEKLGYKTLVRWNGKGILQ
ncbi:MAG: GNAT family N-acetyltransferase [Ruminococcus sp.]|nr:GNAT family N-acetyltransferase [Ruminococcus sp.]